MIGRVKRLWRSVRYTRPHQLWHRLRLTVKRHAFVQLAQVGLTPRYVPTARSRMDGLPPLADPLPRPVFPARSHLCESTDRGPRLRFLNRKHDLQLPMDWDPPEFGKATRLEHLVLHQMDYLEAVADDLFVALLFDWIRGNRPFGPLYWNKAWNGYALSIRCLVWMQQYALRQPALDPAQRDVLLASLVEQLRFLERNLEIDLGGNHVIKNAKTLVWAGAFFSGPEARRWSETGIRLLKREIDEQILPDGMHYERSPAYHAQVFADLLECRHVIAPCEWRTTLDQALERMAGTLQRLTHPDGRVSLFNDGGLHMAYPPDQCMDVYARLGFEATETAAAIHLPDAGYFGLRRDGNYLLVDCGAIAPDFLPAHGHGDILAFEWDVQGQRLIVDAGVYEYFPGPRREYSRSTRAHNTVTIDDADQCEFWLAFRVGRRARASVLSCAIDAETLVLEGTHNGYRDLSGSPHHVRRIESDARRIDVRDVVKGGDGQPVRARLLCHPDCAVDRQGDGIVLRRGSVRALLRSDQPIRIEEAWWLPDFGVRHATRQICVEYGAAPCSGGFVLEAD